ncbi:MAG: universal stress protein [Piscinibacter sp.]|jgi:nucleotide-binding universal stress UspA family protein|uniref:universal stress protein n=1 Tax=Piscinibacter sp. TaxID=1903157 RepID=UPI001B3EE6B3|nr:universal stress protein [Piscinibacter sp.]MBP5990032.1 universal stress protein [Piscinibacter sp.]MBP6026583.1 universal stress protein [Piscinibacter sp.]MBS0443797.1 universal stress protein [Pseudomonadota bacterium]
MKILLAVDGSDYTKRMLAYLAAHDEWLGDRHEYTVLNTVTPVPARAASVIDRDTLKSYYADTSEAVFKSIRTFFKKQGIAAEFVGKVGHAPELIAKTADAGKYDLLVMGSHGHGTLGNLVMGSVATKVLSACKTPVLLIR